MHFFLGKLSPAQSEKNERALATDHLLGALGTHAASGSLISIFAQVLRMALQLGSIAILSRLLLPEDFGLLATATSVTIFVALFADFGLTTATVQRENLDQDTVSGLYLVNCAIGAALALLTCVLAPMAAHFFGDDRILAITIALAPTMLIGAAAAQHSALLRRGMRWFTLHKTAILPQSVALVIAGLLAWQTELGYWVLVISTWVTAVLNLLMVRSASQWRPSRIEDWRNVVSSLRFGGFLTGFTVMNFFHRNGDNVLIAWRLGASQLGLYSRAYALFMLPQTMISGALSGALGSALYRTTNDLKRFTDLYSRAVFMSTSVTGAVALILFFSADALVDILLGSTWHDSADVLRILSVTLILQPAYSSIGHVFLAFDRTREKFFASIPAAIVYVTAFAVGLNWGISGVAMGYLVAFVFVFPAWLLFATAGTGLKIAELLAPTGIPIFSAIASGLTVWLLDPAFELPGYVDGLVSACLAVGFYCFAFAFGVVNNAFARRTLQQVFRLMRGALLFRSGT